MNQEPKKKNENPASNFRELVPEDKVDPGEKVVKKPEDKDYTRDEPRYTDPAGKREREEQPVDPVKQAPKE